MPEAVTPPTPVDPRTRPDPTLLTIDVVRREVAMLESLLNARIDAETDLTAERFRNIEELIALLENLRKEQKEDTKEAVEKAFKASKELVDAAFAASEKAILKAEVSIEKRADTTYVALTSLQALLGNLMTRTETEQRFEDHLERIQSLKNSITIMESMKMGQSEQKTETRQVNAGVLAAIGMGVTLLLAVIAVLAYAAGGG